jgi:hypothetical protein
MYNGVGISKMANMAKMVKIANRAKKLMVRKAIASVAGAYIAWPRNCLSKPLPKVKLGSVVMEDTRTVMSAIQTIHTGCKSQDSKRYTWEPHVYP